MYVLRLKEETRAVCDCSSVLIVWSWRRERVIHKDLVEVPPVFLCLSLVRWPSSHANVLRGRPKEGSRREKKQS